MQLLSSKSLRAYMATQYQVELARTIHGLFQAQQASEREEL
jgi:hypothetical protein